MNFVLRKRGELVDKKMTQSQITLAVIKNVGQCTSRNDEKVSLPQTDLPCSEFQLLIRNDCRQYPQVDVKRFLKRVRYEPELTRPLSRCMNRVIAFFYF